jgi:hypothetical protein
MEIFRIKSKVQKFDTIKGAVTHAYLGFNFVGQERFMCIVIFLTDEISGKTSESVIVSTGCINKAI